MGQQVDVIELFDRAVRNNADAPFVSDIFENDWANALSVLVDIHAKTNVAATPQINFNIRGGTVETATPWTFRQNLVGCDPFDPVVGSTQVSHILPGSNGGSAGFFLGRVRILVGIPLPPRWQFVLHYSQDITELEWSARAALYRI